MDKEKKFKQYRFEDLEVWKISIEIIKEVYRLCKKLPDNEKFGIISQFQRAATSIALNIAEGSGQPAKKAFILYIERAKSSNLECVACEKIILELAYITQEDSRQLRKLLETEYFKLTALRNSLARSNA